MRRALKWLLAAAGVIAAYLLLWPTPLNPYAWTPPLNPGTGPGSPFRPTQQLRSDEDLAKSVIQTKFTDARRPVNFGPEDVAVRPGEGRVYTGIGDGNILSIDPASGETRFFANTGGRPLGVTFDAAGDTLYVADAKLGLLSVDRAGSVTVLANAADGEPATFADNLDVADDGTVWFSELQEDVELGALSMGHAKALLQLQNPERRRHLRDRIGAEALSVRAAEALARSRAAAVPASAVKPAAPKAAPPSDPNLRHLVSQLESHLMTRR